MLRTILLHVGSPKCGSTYLQRVLLRNQARLGAAGIAYPHNGGNHPGNAAGLRGITGETLDIVAKGAHTLVLSHEDLFAAFKDGQSLSETVTERGLDLHLLVFLRPFSGFVFGDYSQFMKQHFDSYVSTRTPYEGRSFEEFTVYRSRVLAVNGWIKGWQRQFPGASMTIANVRDIRRVVAPLLPGADLDWEVPVDATNPSLRMEDCDRLAMAIRDPDVSRWRLSDMLKEALKKAGCPDAGRTPERIAWIEAIFGKQNADLLESFGFDNRLSEAKVAPEPVTLKG
ncbi:hypothetical protein [Oceanicola sp. 22II-s10i]|uniref:hypothetical protein n=1 Tax=Oceanicola sp. 22II-s10i TaxID=1317116 RepID=UPI000B520774|nr:hypothetical protein [Oceanicola sp. 22II-s10i]